MTDAMEIDDNRKNKPLDRHSTSSTDPDTNESPVVDLEPTPVLTTAPEEKVGCTEADDSACLLIPNESFVMMNEGTKKPSKPQGLEGGMFGGRFYEYGSVLGDSMWSTTDDITEADDSAYADVLEKSGGNLKVVRDELFHACHANFLRRVEAICNFLRQKGIPLQDSQLKDTNSATVLHVAILCRNNAAIKILLQHGGSQLVNQVYDDDEKKYSGANAVHLCVSTRNKEALAAILDLPGMEEEARTRLICQETSGSLTNGRLTNTTLPLFMAACTGDTELVDLIISKGAELDVRDSQSGDSLFHVLARYSLHDANMAADLLKNILGSNASFEWWNKRRGAKQQTVQERGMMKRYLLRLRNDLDETPLQMAARLEALEFVDALMTTEDVYHFTQWECGPSRKVLYDVTEVEPAFAGRGKPAVLELLLYNTDNPSWCNSLVFKEILNRKWQMFRLFFILWAILHFCLMLVFTNIHLYSFYRCKEGPPMMLPPPGFSPPAGGAVSQVNPQGSPSGEPQANIDLNETGSEVYNTSSDAKAEQTPSHPTMPPCTMTPLYLVGELFCVLMAVCYSILELYDMWYTMWRRGLLRKFLRRACPPCQAKTNIPFSIVMQKDFYWNIVGIFFISILVPRTPFVHNPPIIPVVCNIITGISGWFLMLSFTRGFQELGFFITMLQKVMFGPVCHFFVVFLAIAFGFSTAIHSVFFNFPTPAEIGSFYDVVSLLFRTQFGVGEPPSVDLPPLVKVFNAIVCFFVLFGSALLVNLLVASTVDTYRKAAATKDDFWMQNRAKAIMMIERRIPHCCRPTLPVQVHSIPVVNYEDVTQILTLEQTPVRRLMALEETI